MTKSYAKRRTTPLRSPKKSRRISTPRMATMKIAHDPNADRALDSLSKAELRQQIERDLEEIGLFLTTERPANTNRGNGRVS